MSRSMKKLFALLLALTLVLSMSSVMAFADEVVVPEEAAETATDDAIVPEEAEAGDAAEVVEEATTEEAPAEEPVVEEYAPAETEPKVLDAVAEVPSTPGDDVVITVLHTNDVHGGIDGYAKLAAYRDGFKEAGKNVVLVDAGDHSQGEAICAITKGEEIIKLMNGTGYDVAIPGNHDFDFGIEQFFKNVEAANYPYVAANFRMADGSRISGIPQFWAAEFDGKTVAFVGISTPETYTKSTPVYFQDSEGNWVYTFSEDTADHPNRFYTTIQNGIDAAKAAGADVVVAVAHTGMDGSHTEWNSQNIIANTTGIDVYIDAHSHEVAGPDYKGTMFKDKDGKEVPYAQTGTKLVNIGEITITIKADGSVSADTAIVSVDSLTEESESVRALIDAANKKVEDYLGEVVGTSEAALTIVDAEGNRIVRNSETNLGDFSADAFRWITGADIAIVNAGGVRKSVEKGDITRAHLTDVHPFGNQACKIEATGQQILDALEHGARNYPDENGGFLQVSGLTYEIYQDVETPVIVDDKSVFQGVDPTKPRRVGNVKIGGVPIDPAKTYTVGGTTYILQLSGDGMAMFANCNMISDAYPNDSNTLIEYLKVGLNGKVTATSYGNERGQGRIVITNKPAEVQPPTDEKPEPTAPTKDDTKTDTSTKTEDKKSSNVPKTGDESDATFYIVLLAGAMGAGVVAYRKRNAA